jgi:hypothetical protein
MSEAAVGLSMKSKITIRDRIRLTDGVLVRELDGEAVILNLNTETYHGLDPVGTQIWRHVTSSASIAIALEQLIREFEVEPEALCKDVLELIETLIENQLVEVLPAVMTSEGDS